ncbi:hypothetical protein [Nocardia gipuzkoensis]
MATRDSDRPTATLLLAKMVGAFILLLASLAWLTHQIYEYRKSGEVEDLGKRGLIVFHLPNLPSDVTIHARQHYDSSDKAVVLQFHVTAPNVTDENLRTEVDVSFLGSGLEKDVKCGENTLRPTPFYELPAQTQLAIETDIRGNRGSATNYPVTRTGSDKQRHEDMIEKIHGQNLMNYRGTLTILDDGVNAPFDRSVSDDGTKIYVEECELSHYSAWRDVQGSNFASASRATLLPFQLNWVSLPGNFDYSKQILSIIVVNRWPTRKLEEAYPDFKSEDDDWYYINEIKRSDAQAAGVFAYTDQPVLLFADRTADERGEVTLLLSGAVLGLAGALFIEFLIASAEFVWHIRRR